jgi:hypothetical protein
MQTLTGSCHCGRVQFEVIVPEEIVVQECNCSICSRSGYLHLIVPQSRFTLLQGEENLTRYTFDTHDAKHLFCKTCGIKSFYIPRSHPDGYSVNLRCLEQTRFRKITLEFFDGKNWEQNIHRLKPLSD